MAEDLPEYQYTPLEGPNAFRMITLLPGKDDDTLRCNISHASMDEIPPYEALSYVWGRGGKRRTITIDCGSSNAILRVTFTCYKSLEFLRYEDKPRVLWIDAICINQCDNPAALQEKDHQVRMMRKIYQNATRVLINPSGTFRLLPREIGILLWHLNGVRRESHKLEIPIPPQCQNGHDEAKNYYLMKQNALHVIYRAWHIMARMEWFQRTWVVQEVALASGAVMILEKMEIPFYEVVSFLEEAFDHRYNDELSMYERLLLHTSLRGAPCRSLLHLAYMCRFTTATRPEDKIYALIGLASDRDYFQNAISHTKDAGDILADFSKRFINQSGNLDLLSIVRESLASEDFPSWAVQWSNIRAGYPSLLNPFGSRRNFNACSNFMLIREEDKNTWQLRLRGINFDLVTWKSNLPSKRDYYEAARFRDILPFLEDEVRQLSEEDPQNRTEPSLIYNDVEKALFNVLSRGEMRTENDNAKGVHKYLFEYYRPVRSHPSPFGEPCKHIFREMEDYSFFLAFVKTRSGYIGLVDKSASEGDLICILAGGSVPYVLRPVPGEEGKYQFISEAYIEGIMDGEAMEGKREDDLQDFCLV